MYTHLCVTVRHLMLRKLFGPTKKGAENCLDLRRRAQKIVWTYEGGRKKLFGPTKEGAENCFDLRSRAQKIVWTYEGGRRKLFGPTKEGAENFVMNFFVAVPCILMTSTFLFLPANSPFI